MRATVALLGLCAGAANAATTGLTVTADNSVYCSTYASTPTNIVTNPSLVKPQDVAVDGNGDIFVVDSQKQELIRIDGTDHTSSVLLGPKYLQVPVGLTISPIHADLYIGDENTSTIWHLACQTRNKNYCAQYYNTPLNLSLATNVHPFGLSMDMDDHLYIADMNGQRVIKRDVTTGVSSVLISVASMGTLAPSKAFNPHDIAIDPNTNELLVTDVTNDDIWTLQCKTPSSTGLSCSVYASAPGKLALDGSNIDSPSGIVTDLSGNIYVSGKTTGVVDEIKGSANVNLLASSTVTLNQPVSLAYDSRYSAKTLYIADDPDPKGTTVGLYSLACTKMTCVDLDTRYVSNVKTGVCTNIPVGGTCNFQCADGYASPNVTSITCGATGWQHNNVVCLSTATADTGNDGAGVAVGVTLAMLVVLGVAVFVFIRYRQGKLIVKRSGDYAPFGSAGV